MTARANTVLGVVAALSLATAASVAIGQELPGVYHTTLSLPTYYPWMNTSVQGAWAKGYEGQGTTITFIDEFSGTDPFPGSWTGGPQVTQLHGLFTTQEAGLIAPLATIVDKDFNTYTSAVSLKSGLNVLNLSYAMYAPSYYKSYGSSIWNGDAQEQSIIADAKNGKAVVVKAAGNDGVAIGSTLGANSQGGRGNVDFLDVALEGAATAIYAGALNNNGSAGGKQTMAYYSDTAGSNKTIQQHFLVVGVDGAATNLYGTSFAAPVISAYAAILGSKFTGATPTQITNQLLDTALTSTLKNYSASVYGRGEANLTGALAPTSIH